MQPTNRQRHWREQIPQVFLQIACMHADDVIKQFLSAQDASLFKLSLSF